MLTRILKGLAPVAALAASTLVAGCDGVNVTIGDSEGVPLAEVDMAGANPSEIVLASPDTIIVNKGDALDIEVSGDQAAVDALRFHLDNDSLAVSREKDSGKDLGTATVRVTMPSLTAMVLAGSGTIEADEMSGPAEATIAGSGSAKVGTIAAEKLEVTIAGSGDFEASGNAQSLEMTIAGTGKGAMGNLQVDTAEVTVAGSGDAEFSSDGTVEANIVGSGTVTVNGSATCEVSSMGSGKLVCRSGAKPAQDDAAEESEA